MIDANLAAETGARVDDRGESLEGPRMPSTEVQLMGSAGVGAAQYGAGQVTAPSPRTMQEQGGKTQISDGAQPASPQASR